MTLLTRPVDAGARRRLEPDPAAVGMGTWISRHAKRWVVVAAVITVVCAVGGALAGASRPLTYTAETRLTVGATTLAAFSVPGYVQATQELASNYARYVNSSQAGVTSVTAATGEPDGTLQSVAASPIPDSNVLRIQVTGTSQSGVIAAVDEIASDLVTQVAQPAGGAAALRAKLDEASVAEAQAQQKVDDAQSTLATLQAASPEPISPTELRRINRAKDRLAQARSAYDVQQVDQAVAAGDYQDTFDTKAQDVALQVIRPGFIAADSESKATQWGAAAGLGLGGLIGALLLTSRYRRRGGQW